MNNHYNVNSSLIKRNYSFFYECTVIFTNTYVNEYLNKINCLIQQTVLVIYLLKLFKRRKHNIILFLSCSHIAIDLQNSAFFCKDMHCKCLKHRSEMDSLCHFIIDACVTSGLNCIPHARWSGRHMPGWTELVKPERDRSLLCHWIWCESGKPRSGVVYDIMRKEKHSYHYAVRSCKKKFETQKQKGIVRISGRKFKKIILLVKLYPTQLVKRTVLTI